MRNKENRIVEATKRLEDAHHEVTQFTDIHWRIGAFDFWPTTGRFLNRETLERGRGLDELLTSLEVYVSLDRKVGKPDKYWRRFFGPKPRQVSSFGPRGQHLRTRTKGY